MKIKKINTYLHKIGLFILFLNIALATVAQERMPEKHFGYIENEIPHIILDIRYYGTNNFLGVQVDGYEAPKAILSKAAIKAMKKVTKDLHNQGYGIKVFDTYRPQQAVDHFVRWSLDPADTLTKAQFYPDIDKPQLFEQGYIAKKSGHSRGSTIDLTLYTLSDGKEVDMGSPFDFFGSISGHGSDEISEAHKANRKLLRNVMEKYGFKAYEEEWWHYTLRKEPFPNTYFNFSVR